MSHCSACLQGLCRRHPLQDHGARAKSIQAQLKTSQKDVLKQSYNDLIKAQIERLENESRGTRSDEIDKYREEMESERDKAHKRKKRKLSDEHRHMALNTGLHSTVLSTMLEGDSDSQVTSSSESESDKKKKSKKKKKSSSKSKKKKKEKEKKHKKKRHRTEEGHSKRHASDRSSSVTSISDSSPERK